MRGFTKRRQGFISALVISISVGFVGLADVNAASTKSIPEKTDHAVRAQVNENYGKLPLSFIRNDGQLNEKVQYYEKGSGHSTYFTSEGVYLELIHSKLSAVGSGQVISLPGNAGRMGRQSSCSSDEKAEIVNINPESPNPKSSIVNHKPETPNLESEVIRLIPLNANKNPEIIAEGMQEGKINYFIGKDPEEWKTSISTYQSVVYKDIYENIDMKFYGNNRQMEYDIIVKPGADVSAVQISYEGTEGLNITEDGRMDIALKEGKVIQNKPYCYQEINGERVDVEGQFKIINNNLEIDKLVNLESGSEDLNVQVQNPDSDTVSQNALPSLPAGMLTPCPTDSRRANSKLYAYSFDVASYDKDYPLYIDPVLEYSTFIGGTDSDSGASIAVDSSGNAYVTGSTQSTDFPTTTGAFDMSGDSRYDIFVTKLNAAGTGLIYSTFIGGTTQDRGSSIAVDSNGNAYLTGHTLSSDFPVTAGAFQAVLNGTGSSFDSYVTKLNATGTDLIYSTYLGGSAQDVGSSIAIDTAGNAYVTGNTQSSDFPTTTGAYSEVHIGVTEDVFVTKLNTTGTSLVYSTFLAGNFIDTGKAIAVDTNGNAYITGNTWSTDFPTTVGAFDVSYSGGDHDAFATKLLPDGSALAYSTLLGGSDKDHGNSIAVDINGNAYVTGASNSADFPTTTGAFDTSHNGNYDAFVTKLLPDGTGLGYSTFIGGTTTITISDWGTDIVVDGSGSAYVTGFTGADFPTTPDAFDATANGNNDAFVTKLLPNGSGLDYSSFFGGSGSDKGYGIALDGLGGVYITGIAGSGFPTTSGAFDGKNNGVNDVFVVKLGGVFRADTDGDGIYDDDEINIYITNPNNSDTDGDGMLDGSEITFGLDPLVNDADLDPDGDGFSNIDEINTYGTDPNIPDLDMDGDGYNSMVFAGGTDCDDTDAAINPGTTEVCNGLDDNCNGEIDELTFTKMRAEMHFSVAISSNGTLWAWGTNTYGQLGDGTTIDRWSPVQVGTDDDWASVAGGRSHSLGLKTDGTLWAWGFNWSGQLGNGSTSGEDPNPIPVQVGSDNDWVEIAAGQYHSLGLKSNGTLWAWGTAVDGALGDGTQTDKSRPVQLGSDSDWVSVAAGLFDHSMGIKTDGTLWAWGWAMGGLGDGTTLRRLSPVQVGIDSNWALVSGGGYHSIGLKIDGTLWTWGTNNNGQLGDGTTADKLAPVQVGVDTDWVGVDAGEQYNLGYKSDGTLWAWGLNSSGQFGDGTTANSLTPVQVGNNSDWVTVSAGALHSFGLKADGTLLAWGYNHNGRLGDGTGYSYKRLTPIQTTSIFSMYYQDADGDGYGNPAVSQEVCTQPAGYVADNTDCNDSDASVNPGAAEVPYDGTDQDCSGAGLTDVDGDGYDSIVVAGGTDCNDTDVTINPGATEIFDGVDNNCDGQADEGFIDADHDGYASVATGGDDCDDTNEAINPGATEVCDGIDNTCNGFIDIEVTSYSKIDAGYYHSVGLKSDGTLWAWGANGVGQLGDGTTSNRYSAVQVGVDSDWTSVAADENHTLGVKYDGTLWTWGRNVLGQLGIGSSDENPHPTPVQVGVDNDWVSVEAGNHCSFGLKSDGTLWAWGFNTYGVLGDGTTTNRYTPVQVGGDNDWASITAFSHALGIKTDGTLWAWGTNGFGQLGNGSSDSVGHPVPVQVGNDSDWASVAAARNYTIGIKTDGTLWTCGLNQYGTLGNGSTDTNPHPTLAQVGSDSDWASATGWNHVLALKTNGALWAWGRNAQDQLGEETPYVYWGTPIQVGSDSDWTSVAAGDSHSLGLKTDSALWTWGHGSLGSLGHGTTSNRNTPGIIAESLMDTYYYQDTDGDGYGDSAVSQLACSQPAGYVTDNTDCNDSDAAVNPGVAEVPNNGIDDDCDPSTPDADADNDGVPDADDLCPGFDDSLDSDADGIPDGCDSFIDSDGDGVSDDLDKCPGSDDNVDVDADGMPDGCDLLIDSDGDGVSDASDAFPFDATETTDSDGDGIGDNADTCPNDADNDADGDGICSDVDNCPAIANPLQENNDGDSEGDACDTDDDNDGIVDTSDTYPFDNDNDGVNDSADTDFTEPGTNVVVEPVDTNPVSTTTTLTFDNIEESGTTTVTSLDDPLFPPPSGFMLSSETHFEIETTATFTDTVTLCITYADAGRDGGDDSIEDTYKLFHYDESQVQWVDITTSLDTVNNVICGKTTSFSPFAVFVDTEVLTPLIEGAIAGGGQSSEVDSFLRYTSPGAKSTSLPVGTTDFDIGIVYGDTINAGTFQATLNGVPFDSFNPGTGETWETVSIPLEPGRNVLVLKVEGAKASGRTATDTDRLVFIVK